MQRVARPALVLRPPRVGASGLVVAACQAVFLLLWLYIALAVANVFGDHRSIDWELYHDAAARWVGGGPWYQPHQVAGPYVPEGSAGDVMYPPVLLWLLAPFVWLPAQLWWAIPMLVMAWGLWTYRPAWWAWLPILAILFWIPTMQHYLYGNPVMWAVAFLWLGLRWSGVAVLVLLKPVLFPFALWGANRRRWWIALGLLALASLPFGAMNLDYVAVVLNARNTSYLWLSVPIMLVPLIAWLGRAGIVGGGVDVAARRGRLEPGGVADVVVAHEHGVLHVDEVDGVGRVPA